MPHGKRGCYGQEMTPNIRVRQGGERKKQVEKAAHFQNYKERYTGRYRMRRREKMKGKREDQLMNTWQINFNHKLSTEQGRGRMHDLHNIIFLLRLVPWAKSALTVPCLPKKNLPLSAV